MNILTINAHVKFIEFLIKEVSESRDARTIGEMKAEFKISFGKDVSELNDQNFGIIKLIPLLLIRENYKNLKIKNKFTYDKRIDIIRHALAHNNFSCDEVGYKFVSDSGECEISYVEFVKFLHKIENDFHGAKN